VSRGNPELLSRLRQSVDAELPRAIDPATGDGHSLVFTLRTPKAPVLTLSRAENGLPTNVPVAFVAGPTEDELWRCMSGVFHGTGEVAKLQHLVAREGPNVDFVVIPALFYLDSATAFVEACTGFLSRPEWADLAWFIEDCFVTYHHEGLRWSLVDGPSGPEALSAPIVLRPELRERLDELLASARNTVLYPA
jgi:hypothetical protein